MVRQEGGRRNPSAALLPNHLGPSISPFALACCSVRNEPIWKERTQMVRQEGCRKNPSATLLPNHLGPVVSALVLCTCACRIFTILLQLARSEPSRSQADIFFPCIKLRTISSASACCKPRAAKLSFAFQR